MVEINKYLTVVNSKKPQKTVLLKHKKMWNKIEYFIKGKRNGIYYFAFGDKYMKIKVEIFNDEKISYQ